jgi:TRAP-type C4-dicarboxylate transport system permease small subunit
MAKFTILIGGLLTALGLVGYFGEDSKSITALIPAFFGIAIGLFGLVALVDRWRAFGMHGAVGISTLGLLAGLGRGIPVFITWLSSDEVFPRSLIYVFLMVGVCLVHVIFCLQSFIAARKSAKTNAASDVKK